MKKNLLLALFISILSLKSYAQSTEIKPGSVLPQMTTAQRTALAAVNGMLVFDTGTQSYWVRRAGLWTEVPTAAAAVNFWQQTGAGGNEIKNINTGGFWSANPVGLTGVVTNITNPPTAPVSGAGTRIMWIPSRSAFRVGTVYDFVGTGAESTFWDANNIGLFSFASGKNTRASGYSSIATGDNSNASGSYSTAMGSYSLADGSYSTALGNYSHAEGDFSTAMGFSSQASGYNSTAMGSQTIASGEYSTAIGRNNIDNPQGLFMVGNGGSNRYTAFIIRKDNSRVGIGVEDPIAKLHVAGNGFVTGGQSSFFYPLSSQYPLGANTITTLTNLPSFTAELSILADYGMVSRTYVGSALNVIASDSRIKKIKSLSNNSEDLERLKKIEITNYTMRDEATWGNQKFKKVIAQQVESVYPEVIKLQTSFIPDIYSLAESVSYDASTKNLRVTLSKDYGIKVGDKIELVHPEKGKMQAEVIAVNGNSFTVKDWNYATEKIFVFGREVNDFRSVDYEALSMLGISAIQALAKENEKLRITIDEVRGTNEEVRIMNAKLQKDNAEVKSRLNTIEASLKQLIPAGK